MNKSEITNLARTLVGQNALDALLDALVPYAISLAKGLEPPKSTPYRRHVLLADDQVEIMVAKWAPNTPCAPHDHGGASGNVLVLEGEMLHQVYEVQCGTLKITHRENRGMGDLLSVPPHMLHNMESISGVGGVTLHVYAPAISSMVIYDVTQRKTLRVAGDCGAWLPQADNAVLKEASGFKSPDILG